MSAVRSIQGKIEIHGDRASEAIGRAKTYLASRDFDKAISALYDAQFHQAMVDELKSVRP